MDWEYEFDEDALDNFNKNVPVNSGVIFLIDVSTVLFDNKIIDKKNNLTNITWYQAIIKGCLSDLKNKAISSYSDSVSVVFFHVKVTTDSMMKTVNVFTNLEPPSVETIKSFMNLEKISLGEFDEKFGFNDEGSLYHALWCCQTLFAKSKVKFGTKKIILFTSEDNPCYKNEEKNTLMIKSRDLRQANIQLELIPVANSSFNFDKFYKTLLMANVDEDKYESVIMSNPVVALEDLMSRIRHKRYGKRAISRLEWKLGSDKLKIGISVYCLVQKTLPPGFVLLDRATNTELITRKVKRLKNTNKLLMPFDFKECATIFNESFYFETDELKKIQAVREPGLTLIGFKPMKYLKSHYQIKPAHFIYPDESVIQGSNKLFSALLNKCAERNLFALCSYIFKRGSNIRPVALVAQLEKVNDDGVQTRPPGFHLVFLPYSDDIRNVELQSFENETKEHDRKMCKNLIQALSIEYEPESILNPSLQKKMAMIEAIALEYDAPDFTEDNTLLDSNEINNHCGDVLQQFKQHFGLDYKPTTSASKAKSRQVTVTELIDLKNLSKTKQLIKLTIPQLKEEALKNGIKINGKNKSDIISCIEKHFS